MARAATNNTWFAKVAVRQADGVRHLSRVSPNRGSLFLAATAMIIVLLFVLFYLWSRLTVVSLGYEIAKANREMSELMADNKRLKLETLSLKSPQRIEVIALDRLGLVYPKREQIIMVK